MLTDICVYRHYNAATNTFYRVDAETHEYVFVEYDEAMALNSGQAVVEEEATGGLGTGTLLPHIADYTFMQGETENLMCRYSMVSLLEFFYYKIISLLGL